MSNVVRFPRSLEQDVTEVIAMVNPTPPHGIPFQTLLQGPASDPDHQHHTARHPRQVPRWVTSTSLVTIGWALGALQTCAALRWL